MRFLSPLLVSAALLAAPPAMPEHAPDYLPDANAQRFLTVEKGGKPEQSLVMLTERVAVKETGPRQTVKTFGEVYAFSPAFLAVPRNKPVELLVLEPPARRRARRALPRADQTALMHWNLPPLSKTPFTYTFHEPGLYTLVCTMHRPEMTAQILVLP